MNTISMAKVNKIILEAGKDARVIRLDGQVVAATIRPSKGQLAGWEFTIKRVASGEYTIRRRRATRRNYIRKEVADSQQLRKQVFANW